MNIMSMDIILIFVFAVFCAGLVKGTCPSTCSCVDYSSGNHVNCNSKYLGRIPTLPKDTYYLDLRFNNITEIDVQLCKEMPQLHTMFDQEMTVCPYHRYSLGINWKASKKCTFPLHVGKQQPQKGVTPLMSKTILNKFGCLQPVGSGICNGCKKKCNDLIPNTPEENECYNERPRIKSTQL